MDWVQEVREVILSAITDTSNFGEVPEANAVYIPLSHVKALRLEANLVVGARGVGKSFWTAALNSASLRERLGLFVPEIDRVDIGVGFGTRESINDYPNADTFSNLLDAGIEPYDIWRSVILRWVASRSGITNIPTTTWEETVRWLRTKPEQAAHMMESNRSWRGLILFDALDRTSTDWTMMDKIVRGLLRTVLWLKSYSGLYAKVFLREDQAERTVFNFPDASKLLATKAELGWSRHDLHGLLWQLLINTRAEHGELARHLCSLASGREMKFSNDVWNLPDDMMRESDAQRAAFTTLAGPWMGRDRRRGIPYSWSVGHLADARGRTSPRSFLAAIKQATEDSIRLYPSHVYPLHYESIKRGIQTASTIRVQEVAEDYPWVPDVLWTLSGTNVPCEVETILAQWEEKFVNGPPKTSHTSLPAQHAERGWEGIFQDLQRLGMIELKKDGRLDMPDLYRVGFKLGRKGGVKPQS
jgi:hypothetical protein